MKKTKRAVYLVLAREIDACLCTFCKYAQWDGECKESEVECTHPLWRVNEDLADDATMGDDCWGYRPIIRLKDIADIVGIILANHFTEWYWQDDVEGHIYVYGEKAKSIVGSK